MAGPSSDVRSQRRLSTQAIRKNLHLLSSYLSKAVLYRSAVAVFGLGFLDAGYSGDWSRIGVISTETEELLKVSAYLALPFCVLLAANISDKDKA